MEKKVTKDEVFEIESKPTEYREIAKAYGVTMQKTGFFEKYCYTNKTTFWLQVVNLLLILTNLIVTLIKYNHVR